MSASRHLGQGQGLWRRKAWLWVCVPVVVILGVGIVFYRRKGDAGGNNLAFTARRGTLPITVVVGGSVEALESQEIRSEVRGREGTKILFIVEEGYHVTKEDVENGKVLVELDSSNLVDEIARREIELEGNLASYIEAQESYEIQINQNESDIKAAKLEAKFACLDMEKYLGEKVAEEIADTLGLTEETVLQDQNANEPRGDSPALAGSVSRTEPEASPGVGAEDNYEVVSDGLRVEVSSTARHGTAPSIDFSEYAKPELLGEGEATQKLRQLQDELVMARKRLKLDETQLEGTKRLHEKRFVTQNELENDQLAVDQAQVKVKSAETALRLFVKYEFPKQAEKFVSDYEEALKKLERTRKSASSKMAQAEAKLKAAEGKYQKESTQLKESREQLEKCVIKAERPGLVVYGGSEQHWYSNERIEEGATVRERQLIITIPDTTEMAVSIKIHESDIQKVAKGLKARVRVDAHPDEGLSGEVVKVAVLPDSQQRWLNPDLKLYPASVKVDGVHDWLKPGLSAEVEILVKELEDVVYVPVQAIHPGKDERVCYVVDGDSTQERRVVETGEFNAEFVEVTKGLEEGEEVLLRPPEGAEPVEAGEDKEQGEERDTEQELAAPSGQSAVAGASHEV